MGKMNDLSIQRDEWKTALSMQLDENLTLIDTPDPTWWRATTDDGILITKIDDSLFVENCIHDWTEILINDSEWDAQLDAEIARHRELKAEHLTLNHLNK